MKKLLLMLAAIFLIGFGAKAQMFDEKIEKIKIDGLEVSCKYQNEVRINSDYSVWPNWDFTLPEEVSVEKISYVLTKTGEESPTASGDALGAGEHFWAGPIAALSAGTFSMKSTVIFKYNGQETTEIITTEFESQIMPEYDYIFDFKHEESYDRTNVTIKYDFVLTKGETIPEDAKYRVQFGIDNGIGNLPANETKSGEVTFTGLTPGKGYNVYPNNPSVTIEGKNVKVNNGDTYSIEVPEDPTVIVPKISIAGSNAKAVTQTTGTVDYKITTEPAEVPGVIYRIWVVTTGEKALCEPITTTELTGTIDLKNLNKGDVTPMWIKVEGTTVDNLKTDVQQTDLTISTADAMADPEWTYTIESTYSGAIVSYSYDVPEGAEFVATIKCGDNVIISKNPVEKGIKVPFDGNNATVTVEAKVTIEGKTFVVVDNKQESDTQEVTKKVFNPTVTIGDLSFDGTNTTGEITYTVEITNNSVDDIEKINIWASSWTVPDADLVTLTRNDDFKVVDGKITLNGELHITGLTKGADNPRWFKVQPFGPGDVTINQIPEKQIVCHPNPSFEAELAIEEATFEPIEGEDMEGYIDYKIKVDVKFGEVKYFELWAAYDNEEGKYADLVQIDSPVITDGFLTGKLLVTKLVPGGSKTVWFKVRAYGENPEEDFTTQIPEKEVVCTTKKAFDVKLEIVGTPTFTANNATEGYIHYEVKITGTVNKIDCLRIWAASTKSEYADIETHRYFYPDENGIITGKLLVINLEPNATTQRWFKVQAFGARSDQESAVVQKEVACTTTATGIDGIDADGNAEAVYYNLQGVRVANPEHGTYIMVKGGKATKVVL